MRPARLFIVPAALALLAAQRPLEACTAFCLSNGREALFANNEDYNLPDTKVWFVPGENGTFGRVYLGYGDNDAFPQGGMNERGLAFDMFSSKPLPLKPSTKPGFRGNILAKMMGECATVEDVIKLFEAHSRTFMQRFIMMVADASGDSVVIEQNALVRKKGPYQIQTNFYQSMTPRDQIPCERYKLAAWMLERAAGEVSVDLCRRVLSAVHQEGNSPTLYSNVFDLKRRVMHLYHFHNYENVVTIDLAAELKKGRRAVDMASLFPPTIAAIRYKRSRGPELKAARRTAVRVDPKVFDAYVGTYSLAGMTFEVTRQGGKLFLEPDAAGKLELKAESENRFFFDPVKGLITFPRAADGTVREMIVHDHGTDVRIPRVAR